MVKTNDKAERLMLGGTMALCPDCGEVTLFVPVEEGCSVDGCEFCCTACDAAVFLLDVPDSSHQVLSRLAS
ncbi:MAG: hypothetical protein ACTHOK_17680 [Nocardioidaceae bacterium]